MKIGAIPDNEKSRLAAVYEYHILDSENDTDFDAIASLASQLCNTSIAVITLVDEKRQWFKSNPGLQVKETHRDLSFCAHTILQDDIMIVPDASKDERFFDNPMVTGDPFIRFYAAAPLVTSAGYKVGTLAVLDVEPKDLTHAQMTGLRTLAKQVVHLLNLRRSNSQLTSQAKEKASEMRDILDRISDAFIAVDTNWLITFINEKAAQITSRIPEDVMNKNLWQVFPEAFMSEFYTLAEAAMTTQEQQYTEAYFSPYSIWIEANIYPSLRGLSIYFRDISGRKKIEEKLVESEQRLRTIFQTEPECIKVVGEGFELQDMNPAGLAMIEADNLEQVKGHSVLGFVSEGYREGFAALTKNVFQGLSGKLEFEIVGLRGTRRWLETRAVSMRDAGGKIISMLGVTRDITQRKKDEESIQKAEERYRNIFENTLDGIYQSTLEGQFLTVNPAMAQMLGFSSPAELISSITDIGAQLYADPQERLRMKDLLEKEGRASGLEMQILKKNKEVIWVRAHIRAERDLHGKIKYFEGTMEDVTERKTAEAKLNSQFDQLQKTNFELDRFVYSVSHDLRAPLSSILGLINIAELEQLPPNLNNYLTGIRQSVMRLDGFIKDILDFSRNARMDLRIDNINFRDMIDEMQNNLKLVSGADRLEVEVTIKDNIPFHCDRTRLSIILNNIFSNAIKYQDFQKPSSFVKINIATAEGKTFIEIADNGIGIPPEHLHKIFDMFYRAHDVSKGSGLGLYIAKETITKLAGHILVKSVYGFWTTFEIVLPDLQLNKTEH